MTLPEIRLDDRRFQDLVSEARTRITLTCPEWTDHNVSDPGITLIELFAWMTEQTIYRLNRIPEKLHVALLELLDIRLDGPTAAATELRFRLPELAAEPVRIPRATEAGTLRTPSDESVIFQTIEEFTIPPLRPAAYVLQRGGQIKDVGVADGEARPAGGDRAAFASPPQTGDALHLGFEEPIARLVLRVDVESSQARGAGVVPDDPPLRWEVSGGAGAWLEAEVLEDLTGGFNYGSGAVELQLPARSAPESLGGHRLHWVRCRITERTASGREGATYTHPPEFTAISAGPVGALLPASHSARVERETIGTSDGSPGQRFALRERPVLPLAADETLEVQQPGARDWVAWQARESFAGSGPEDRHFVLDLVSGELELGPAVRQSDAAWRQYGAVPPKGSVLRVSSYRHGGGRKGNVAEHTLTVLKSAIAGVATVANPRAATGGVDAETLDAARRRAALEIRARDRAVTAADFEFLAGEASPRVARTLCVGGDDGAPVTVRLLPHAEPPDRRLEYDELVPDEALFADVAAYLDERRLIGTRVELQPVRFRGVSVVVNLQSASSADPVRVEQDVGHALYTYLNPLVGGSVTGRGTGWPFGRPLNQGELYGVIHAIEGVDHVKVLRLYETDLTTGEQSPQPTGTHILLEPDELLASGRHIVKATRAIG